MPLDVEYTVCSQGRQLQAITGWSSFSLIPKTMDHFWKYRLHLYPHMTLCASTCMHSFIQLTAQLRRAHFSTHCLTWTHSNAIWDVQHSSTPVLWGTPSAPPTEAGESVQHHAGSAGTPEPIPGALFEPWKSLVSQCLTQDDRHCMHRLYCDFLKDSALKQRQGWHYFENHIQDT